MGGDALESSTSILSLLPTIGVEEEDGVDNTSLLIIVVVVVAGVVVVIVVGILHWESNLSEYLWSTNR